MAKKENDDFIKTKKKFQTFFFSHYWHKKLGKK